MIKISHVATLIICHVCIIVSWDAQKKNELPIAGNQYIILYYSFTFPAQISWKSMWLKDWHDTRTTLTYFLSVLGISFLRHLPRQKSSVKRYLAILYHDRMLSILHSYVLSPDIDFNYLTCLWRYQWIWYVKQKEVRKKSWNLRII